jgi:hypothetical protein
MAGHVAGVQVDYLIETPDGTKRVTVNLESMRAHCRAERVEDLVEDLFCLIGRARALTCRRARDVRRHNCRDNQLAQAVPDSGWRGPAGIRAGG